MTGTRRGAEQPCDQRVPAPGVFAHAASLQVDVPYCRRRLPLKSFDRRLRKWQAVPMAYEDETRSAAELLAAAAANVAAVPMVLGFVALGGVVLAGRAVAEVLNYALMPRPRHHEEMPEPPLSR